MPHRDARILAVVLSIFLAWVTYRFIERPIRFGSMKGVKSVALIGLITILGSVGLWIDYIGGSTPYNKYYKYISEAKGDWAYPNGLVGGNVERVFYTSNNRVEVVFLGDSHIEQYGPRVVGIYAEGASKEVAFITSGGCPPIPNVYEDKHKDCFGLLERLEGVLAQNDVETIVIGASFNSYLGKLHTKGTNYEYYFREDGLTYPFYEEDGLRLATESFYAFVSKLTNKYQVVVLLDIPTGKRFDPNTLLKADGGRRTIPIRIDESRLSFAQAEYQIHFANKMKERLSELNVNVIDQAALICPNGICRSLNEEGKPIYKDGSHMRPFFVKEYMDVLDPYVLLTK